MSAKRSGKLVPMIASTKTRKTAQVEGVHVVGVHLECFGKVLLGFHYKKQAR
jgi:hypothetical protein